MSRYEAIGVVETQYYAVAMEMLDCMCKQANVQFLTSENYLGGRLVSLIVGGSIPDVAAAIDAAKRVNETKDNKPLKMALTITNPHEEILKYVVPQIMEESIQQEAKTKASVKKRISKNNKQNEEDLS